MPLPALLQFEDYEIRIIDLDGEPWWLLADVCRVLEIANAPQVASRLDEDEKGICIVDTLGGSQELTVISEPGLYKLLQTSRKPIAKRFDRWNRHDVLPSIRKTGSYGSQVPEVAQQIISGLKEALAPLAIRFDGQDKELECIKQQQGAMAEDIASIKKVVFKGGRRRPSPTTIMEHIRAVGLMGGRCPCCALTTIVVGGQKIPLAAECDHFYQNSQADLEHTWVICTGCHDKFSSGKVSRHERVAEFQAYQHQRDRLPEDQMRMQWPT